ncbi:hypothetical protein [Agathobaculum sp.]|uniref:hypothetical protein n=1 Tax=Agathobaculum sp. TaxID=2048138 RepID=UPI002A80E042|nr:hypothetical protein [Agathobaculum sp.]MDY3617618.1 hypothetical protein [Agathobaculum sp.]
MKPYQFANPETVRQTVVRRFGGVDFRTHPTKASLSRSPDMQNMVCEQNDFLVKRTGWQTQQVYDGAVYGVFPLPDGTGAVVHAGKKLFCRSPDGTQAALCADMNEAFSQSFTMKGALYLLDGKTYRAVRRNDADTAWEAVPVRDHAFVPTTTISAAPTGGGTSYEAVNLLTPKRINTFIGNGSATQFQVDAKALDDAPVTATVNGNAVTVSSVNRATGMVTLSSAPANGNGLANVAITFSKTVEGYAGKIDKCRFAGLYGGKNDTRVFLAGNPNEPDCDWQSGLYDPTYFPDTGYTRMGTDASAIMGYLKQYESQLVVKSGGAQESTSFLRTYLMADDGTALYPLKQGAQGAGAVSYRTFASLNDLPLFLSSRGVMGVYGTAVAEQRSVRPISDAVLPKLEQESGLEDACAVVHADKYYLAVNGHMYVADGRLTEDDGAPAWFYLTHVPAQCLAVLGNQLWFGTADGRLCRFKEADEDNAYNDDDTPIDAYWRTPTLPLSQWGRVKTVRDVIPTLMPYSRSGATVQYENENGTLLALSQNMDLFSFDTLDFSRFSFRCVPGAVSYRTRWRQHKTPLFAVRIGNDRPGEPFGLLALTVRWTLGRTVI